MVRVQPYRLSRCATGPGVATGDAMPFRFRYPAIVQRMNRANYEQALKSMGSDEFKTRLIWQKR
ncbi:MAG: hypothetical protein LUE99_05355 [Bacteroides sp.]|nr:hypothetical protein [Bacteroides sp.]